MSMDGLIVDRWIRKECRREMFRLRLVDKERNENERQINGVKK